MTRLQLLASGLLAGSFAISLASSPHAEAVVRYPGRHEPEKPDNGWYGWQIAISDVAAAGLLYWGIEADHGEPLFVGGLAYMFVPPTIHALHDRQVPMVASFGMRLVFPLFTGFLTFSRGGDDDSGDNDNWPEFVLTSMAVASALDIGFLSVPWERQRPEKATIRPLITLARGRMVIGAGAAF